MSKIQNIKHQQALEYWSQIVKEQQESGLSVKAFCRSRQMSHHAMYYWIKETREEGLPIHPELHHRTQELAVQRFSQESRIQSHGLQHHRDLQGQWPGSLHLSDLPV